MDFRQCPACQSSVLDDDAADCPFCGASMSGKPAAAPAKPEAPQAPASKPKAGVPAKAKAPKRQSPMRKVGETVADEDDPFGVDTSSVAQVPKAAPRPAKGRMIRIVCPMCETPGFISSKMQGRDIKCCNPDCMVPVFKAPAPEKEVADERSKGGALSGQTIGIAAAVIVPLAGLILWGFVFSRGGGGSDTGQNNTPTENPFNDNRGKGNVELAGGDGDQPDQPAAPAETSLAEIKQGALEQIVIAAQLRDDNRKPYGRRLAAESYALVGDLTEAAEQLKHLKSVGAPPYFETEPLLLIAWQQLRGGDAAGARATLARAQEAFRGLREVGREELTAALSLAAAQAAMDQLAAAKATLGKVEPEPARARLVALMQIVGHIESFDLDGILEYSSLDMVVDPLAVAVSTEIAAQGHWDKAIAWARAQQDSASQDDCLTALAVSAARHQGQTGDDNPVRQLTSLSEELSTAGQTRLEAGFATGYLMLGKRTESDAALAKAAALFATIERPNAVATPDIKTIHNSRGVPGAGLPDASPLRSAAVAAAQLARLQMLTDQREIAWSTLLTAWEFTTGIGPSFRDMTAFDNERKQRIEQRLRRELRLRDSDEEFRAYRQFTRQLRIFLSAARTRFDLESALLREANGWGFKGEVASFREQPAASFPAAAGQPYQQALEDDQLTKLFVDTEELFRQGKHREAAATLASLGGRQPESVQQRRDQRAMQLACRLLKQKQVDQLFEYVDALKDPWLSEDCLEMTAALGVLDGQASTLWRRFPRHDLEATQRVALYRGLIAGIVAAERKGSQPTATAATEADPVK